MKSDVRLPVHHPADDRLRGAVFLRERPLADASSGVPLSQLVSLLVRQDSVDVALSGRLTPAPTLRGPVGGVVRRRSKEQVLRVDAGRNIAAVAHKQPRADRLSVVVVDDERDTVGTLFPAPLQSSVSSRSQPLAPQPAPVLVFKDRLPDVLLQFGNCPAGKVSSFSLHVHEHLRGYTMPHHVPPVKVKQ